MSQRVRVGNASPLRTPSDKHASLRLYILVFNFASIHTRNTLCLVQASVAVLLIFTRSRSNNGSFLP